MIKIETIEIAGFAAALSALRLPFGKEMRSDIAVNNRFVWHYFNDSDGTPSAFDGYDNTYKSRLVINIFNDDIKLMNTLVKRGTEHAKVTRGIMVWAKITAPIYWWCEMETYVVGHQRLSSESTMHVDCRGLSGDDLVAAKAAIPMGKELTKVDAFSYQALRNIAKQRWNHRLPEWHVFVDWVKTLPFSQELILDGLDIEEDKI